MLKYYVCVRTMEMEWKRKAEWFSWPNDLSKETNGKLLLLSIITTTVTETKQTHIVQLNFHQVVINYRNNSDNWINMQAINQSTASIYHTCCAQQCFHSFGIGLALTIKPASIIRFHSFSITAELTEQNHSINII